MKEVMKKQAAKFSREAATTVEEMILPSTKVTFGAGVTVERVLTGYEACRVLVKNLPLTATKAEVATLFTQPGFDPTRFTVRQLRQSRDRSHLEAVVEFEDVEDGKNATAGLDGIEFGSVKLKLVLTSKQGGMGKSKDLSHILTVTWLAPSNTAFASYSSVKEANFKQVQLDKKTFRGRQVKVKIAQKPPKLPNRYWNPATISISGLAPGASRTDIEGFCGTTSIRVPERNPHNYNLNDAIPSLQSLIAGAYPGDHQSVTYEPNLVPNERGAVSVKIRFPLWEHAKAIHGFLDRQPLPFCPSGKFFAFLPDPLHYTIHVPYPQYKVQEKQFRSLTRPKRPFGYRSSSYSCKPTRPACAH